MRLPLATYRLQLTADFGFREARAVLGYLAELGVSDVYASPISKARKGSTHGYDVVDPNQSNPELGDPAELEALFAEVGRRSMGWVQDIVPNHMAYDRENAMLMDVLENGRHSRFEGFFDLDWTFPYEARGERVLAPFLGRFYGEALEAGEIRVEYDEEGLGVRYYDHRLPLRIESYEPLLTERLGELREELTEDHPDFIKFLGLLYGLRTASACEEPQERYDMVRFSKRMLRDLYRGNRAIRRALDDTLRELNGEPGRPESFDALDRVLSRQLFRLSFWKVATEEVDYRRFFTINDLISIRVEREEVFEQTHRAVLERVRQGRFTGLRVDHIDGLYDPGGYLARLRQQAPDAYVIVEKILEPGEKIPAAWPVQGTTGYEFLNRLNGLFVDPRAEADVDRVYRDFTGWRGDYGDLLEEKKRLILYRHLSGDVDNLARLLKSVTSTYRHGTDITLYGLRRAIAEVMVALPVYRTYVGGETPGREEDPEYVRGAVEKARQRFPGLVHELDFLERFLLLEGSETLREEDRERWAHFVRRFQQFSGPLMAKGFEDTFLYVYNRLLSLNEVGGSPGRFGYTPAEFHRFNAERATALPHTLNATATHDTKRGEDVRARLNVLSEIPEEWGRVLREWRRGNAGSRTRRGRIAIPDRNDEYFLYQILVGSWPFEEGAVPGFRERLEAYLIKAVREAKAHTGWLKPDEAYEAGYLRFAREILEPAPENTFLPSFLPFQRKVSHFGVVNSLSQALLKIAAPGVPDFYRGTELWDLSLVDPDNRRPVDFRTRAEMLGALRRAYAADPRACIEALQTHPEDGGIKLFLIHRALSARQRRPSLFGEGVYLPVPAEGRFSNHVVAFARRHEGAWAVAAVPRFAASLVEPGKFPVGRAVWADTRLRLPAGAPRRWTDAITGRRLRAESVLGIGDVLKEFPVALLVG